LVSQHAGAGNIQGQKTGRGIPFVGLAQVLVRFGSGFGFLGFLRGLFTWDWTEQGGGGLGINFPRETGFLNFFQSTVPPKYAENEKTSFLIHGGFALQRA
jgi:hypothetical protein